MCTPNVRFFSPKVNIMNNKYLTEATYVDSTVRYIDKGEPAILGDEIVKLRVLSAEGDLKERSFRSVTSEEIENADDNALQTLFYDLNFELGEWVETTIPYHVCPERNE